MVSGANTYTYAHMHGHGDALLLHNQTHEHATQTNAGQANKRAQTLAYVRVCEAARGPYTHTLLLEMGQKHSMG